MKKYVLPLFLLALFLPAIVSAMVPHRLIYGYFQYSNVGYGFGKFYTDALQDIQILEPGDGETGVFCGAAANGIYYACEYKYSPTSGPVPTVFTAYNLSTHKKTEVGPYSDEDSNPYLKFQDMTFDNTTDTMYAIGFELGLSSLFAFDLSTGKPVKVVDLDANMSTLACNKEGQLYGMAHNGKLYQINKKTGKCTQIYDTTLSGLMGAQSMEFDHTNGKLYWASRTLQTDGNAHLVEVDMTQTPIVHTDLGAIGGESAIQGLYIPYVLDGDNAPDAPTELSVKPAPMGVHKASLSWTNPTHTFGGEPLTELQSIAIFRNNEQIAALSPVSIGAEMTYEDNDVPERGEYRYSVLAINATGKGRNAESYVYIGNDMPDIPLNIAVEVGDGCSSATIRWENPAKGAHDGYYTADGLSYRIVRYPDEVEVGRDIAINSFTDTSLRRLGQYYYKVYAVNAYGESGEYTPDAYVLGKAFDLTGDTSYTLDFNNKNLFYNQWTVKDGNKDAYSWTFNTMAPTYQFRSAAPGAEYFINPGIVNDGNDADEWLISPPFSFRKGTSYQIILSARVVSTENIEITTALTNEVSKQVKVQEVKLTYDANTDDGTSPIPFVDYIVNLPQVTDDYTGCVGVHLVTPYPANHYSMLQITSITVKELDPSGINNHIDNVDDTEVVARYSADGRKVASSHKGLQIQKLANGKTVKVVVR